MKAITKKTFLLAAALTLAGFGCSAPGPAVPPPAKGSIDAATFIIDGKAQTLAKGKLMLFGAPTPGDLDGDGDPDAAVLLVATPGGSGTFYYAAAAINDNGTYAGTNAVLLGDRVAPQNVAVSNGMIVANYAERKPGEPFTAQPSVGVSKYIRVENGQLSAMPKP